MASGSVGGSTPIRRRVRVTASPASGRAASSLSDSGSHTSRIATAASEIAPPKVNSPGQPQRGRMMVEMGPAKAVPKP